MPPREVTVWVIPAEPHPVDGLCPRCWLPSLVQVDLFVMGAAGVSKAGTWTGCSQEDCNEGTT